MKKKTIELSLVLVSFVCLSYVLCFFPNKATDSIRYNVLIESTFDTPFGDGFSIGSGVLIDNTGTILTAAHVVDGAKTIRITLHDGRVFDVNDYYVDKLSDIGFIDLPGEFKDHAEIYDPNVVGNGDKVYHIGNPHGILKDVLKWGIVVDSHFKRVFFGNSTTGLLLKLEAYPGCSGGGIYCRHGGLIGIVDMGFDEYIMAIDSEDCKEAFERYIASKD